MEEHSFDSLAKEMADSTISRGQVLKLVGGAVLGAFGLVSLPSLAEAKKKKKKHHHAPSPPSPPPPGPPPPTCGSSQAGCKVGACVCPSGTVCTYTALSGLYGICCTEGKLCA